MFYLRVKLRFYGLDEKSFLYFTFKIISGVCQDIGIGGIGAVSWVVNEVLSKNERGVVQKLPFFS